MGSSSCAVTTVPGPGSPSIRDSAVEWLRNVRHINRSTLERMPVGSASGVYFPKLGRESDAVVFLYPNGIKARSYPEKAFRYEKGSRFEFWNIEAVLAGCAGKFIYGVEGEMDALALVEAGIPPDCVLSIPGSARRKDDEEERDIPRGYRFVEEALGAGLNKAKGFVWCGDEDAAGHGLRQDMVSIFGMANFYFVEWPCKDANDVLIKYGRQFVYELVTQKAKLWPAAGLHKMSDFPEPPPMEVWEIGLMGCERKIRLVAGTLCITTGHPGHGKTHLTAQITYDVVRRYNLLAAVASFETRIKPQLRRWLRGFISPDGFPGDFAAADKWIDDHYVFVGDIDRRSLSKFSFDRVLDLIEVAVVRHGARIIIIDPWNRLDHARNAREQTETEYIGECLRMIYNFAQDYNCWVNIIGHPRSNVNKNKRVAPDLDDISGSKMWDNVPDQGLVVHRKELFKEGERCYDAMLIHRKARFDEIGYQCSIPIKFNPGIGRFVTEEQVAAEQMKTQASARYGD